MLAEPYRGSIEACHACVSACRQLVQAEARDAQCDASTALERRRHELDCSDICQLTAEWLEQDSRYAPLLCEVCAVVCNALGDELAKRKEDSFAKYTYACRRCAEECRRLVGGAVPEIEMSIGTE